MITLNDDQRLDLLNFQPVGSYVPFEIKDMGFDRNAFMVTLVVFRDDNDINTLYGFVCRIKGGIKGQDINFTADPDVHVLTGHEVKTIEYHRADEVPWEF